MKKMIGCLVLVACGGGGGGGGGFDGDAEDPSEFCRAAAQLQCEAAYSCLTQAERDAKKLPATQPECERAFESKCESAVDSCADTTHAYASDMAGTCLREMDAATCADAGEPFLDAKSCANVCAPTAGKVRVAWQFNPASYSCSQVGVESVSIYAVPANRPSYIDTYYCWEKSGMTDALPVGTYAVHLEMFDVNNQRRWMGPTMSVKVDRDVVDLGTITVPVQ